MDTENQILQFLRTLAENTARELWRVARKEVTPSRLVLPKYRNEKRRLSEQEARSIAQRIVSDSQYFYSIETPTPGTHNFSGKPESKGRSAQHDLSFYTSPDPEHLVAHAEFKQGHRSGDDGVQVIFKDLKKLLDSGKHCLWFHSFPRPTKNEFDMLHEFFRKALDKALAQHPPNAETKVVLGFCAVVDPAAWIAGPLSWSEVRAAIDAFPVSTKHPHPAWMELRVTSDMETKPAAGNLDFIDLEEPHGGEGDEG